MAERHRTRCRGTTFTAASLARAMKSGTCSTVIDTSCLMDAPSGLLDLRKRVAHAPERARLLQRRGDRRVGDDLVFEAPWRAPPPSSRRLRPRRGRRRFPPARTRDARSPSGSRASGRCATSMSMRMRGISSKAVRLVPARSRARRKSFSASAGVATAAIADGLAARHREQPQHGRGDDAERSLRTDEELLQVVAGIVLHEAAQAVPDLAGRQHHLQPEHQAPRVAVGEHRRAAGIGGDVAADAAGALATRATAETACRPPPPPRAADPAPRPPRP